MGMKKILSSLPLKLSILILSVFFLSSCSSPRRQNIPEPLDEPLFLDRDWIKIQSGTASWYGDGFYYKATASGEIFRPGEYYTAAHNQLPLGILALVRNVSNGKIVFVKINDRGPFIKNRIIDLSKAAAEKIDILKDGTGNVELYIRKNTGPSKNK